MEKIICPITMEEIEHSKQLDCNHVFEAHALEQWLIDNNTCPVCRFKVYEKKIETQMYSDVHYLPNFLPVEFPAEIDNLRNIISSVTLTFNGRTMNVEPDNYVLENVTRHYSFGSFTRTNVNVNVNDVVHVNISAEDLQRMTIETLGISVTTRRIEESFFIPENQPSINDFIRKVKSPKKEKTKHNKYQNQIPKFKCKNKFNRL